MRVGLSLSMNYVIIGVIALAVAGAVIFGFTTNFSDFEDLIGGGISESEKSLAREECIRQKQQLCSLESYANGSKAWEQDAEYKGKTCKTWISTHGVLPNLKNCGDSYR